MSCSKTYSVLLAVCVLFCGIMSMQSGSLIVASSDSCPPTPTKSDSMNTPQNDLRAAGPVVNGFRQSTISFKIERSTIAAKPPVVAIEVVNNENVAPAFGSDTDNSVAMKKSIMPPPKSTRTVQRRKITPRDQKQSLLFEKPDAEIQPCAESGRKDGRLTGNRRAASRRSVSATVAAKAQSTRKAAEKACSLSPKKQLRSGSPAAAKASGSRLRQTQLFNYGVRRTARQFAKDLQQQKEAEVVEAILKCEESGMKVITTEEKGRGVVTTRHFAQGEFVVEYVGDLISDSEARAREVEYRKDPTVGSFMFFFAHGGQRFCVDATAETDKLGRLINHSRQHPNCVVRVVPIDGVPRLALFAKTDIPPGEELLYDYGDRGKESLIAHPWLKN